MIMSNIRIWRTRLDQQKGQRNQVLRTIDDTKNQVRGLKKDLRRHEQAREIIKTVGLATQEQLSYHISDITSLALGAVFDDPYELVAEFTQRRNKTECDLLFKRDGELMNPLTASGGGTVDVAAFALRIASWSMQQPRSRNTIILDEPLRFLSEDKQEKASMMLKEISEKLGIQFIIITHETTLTEYADKIFQVSIHKGKSKMVER